MFLLLFSAERYTGAGGFKCAILLECWVIQWACYLIACDVLKSVVWLQKRFIALKVFVSACTYWLSGWLMCTRALVTMAALAMNCMGNGLCLQGYSAAASPCTIPLLATAHILQVEQSAVGTNGQRNLSVQRSTKLFVLLQDCHGRLVPHLP